MTLIIGVKCSNGVVIGADGAATLGAMGKRTILQPMKKLDILEGKLIFSLSGPVGLGQLFKGDIQKAWESHVFEGKESFEVMATMRDIMWPHAKCELENAAIARNAIGNIALESALSSVIIAMPVKNKFALFQFNQQCSPEEATEDLPFVSTGSGQPIADPFLAFLRRLFWKNGPPSLSEGILAVVWTLLHTILINPGGVANPKQVVILEKEGNNFIARELSPEELQEHYEFIDNMEKKISDLQQEIRESSLTGEAIIPLPSNNSIKK